ncbi:DUF6220 domain-containing protein [Paenibacillus lautus]|uniref:DUF6220 domain-containing protein n=1 Tax=Paenibacillus lautus TaxID=1401 RepID=UPI003D2E3DF0
MACLFVICVTTQILIAGMAVFYGSVLLAKPFVRVIELFPILMLFLSFTGKLPNFLRWMIVLNAILSPILPG